MEWEGRNYAVSSTKQQLTTLKLKYSYFAQFIIIFNEYVYFCETVLGNRPKIRFKGTERLTSKLLKLNWFK